MEVNKTQQPNSSFDQIEPAAIDFEPLNQQTLVQPDKPSKNKIFVPAVFVGLLVLLILVFGVLPNYVQPKSVATATQEVNETPESAVKPDPTAEEKVSPYSAAQIAKQRSDAQDILAQLLEKQFQLDDMRVELWAKASFITAKREAEIGDGFYQEQQFIAAQQRYQQADQLLDELINGFPQRLDEALAKGEAALQGENQLLAQQAFNLALKLDTGSQVAELGLERAAQLQQLVGYLVLAQSDINSSQLKDAKAKLLLAQGMDDKHKRTAEMLTSLTGAINNRDFTAAMSRGYGTLNKKDYASAIQFFNQAIALRGNAGDAKQGLELAKNQWQQQKISAFENAALAAINSENWPLAIASYNSALELDKNLLFAQRGIKLSSKRQQLDIEVSNLLADPIRITQQATKTKLKTLITTAKRVVELSDTGVSRLNEQVQRLVLLQKKAEIPTQVRLTSDGSTNVTVYKVAKMGQFSQQQLLLKPGKYTAVGVRAGYRDVRQEFIIPLEGAVAAINVVCVEPISQDG